MFVLFFRTWTFDEEDKEDDELLLPCVFFTSCTFFTLSFRWDFGLGLAFGLDGADDELGLVFVCCFTFFGLGVGLDFGLPRCLLGAADVEVDVNVDEALLDDERLSLLLFFVFFDFFDLLGRLSLCLARRVGVDDCVELEDDLGF